MRWKCVCAYDGTDFSGWQTQSGRDSVQQTIETALEEIFKSKTRIEGSGRTDAGVHALGQVFHFDFPWRHGSDRLVKALYPKLPRTIQILSTEAVDDSFHARFSAVTKRYHYRLRLGQADPFRWRYCWSLPERVDLNRMAEAMSKFVGCFDFAPFAVNRGVDYESTVRTLTRTSVTADADYCYLTFEAEGFMYRMVRSLVGAVVNIGLGRMRVEDLDLLLAGKLKRTAGVQTAPARGLFLERVFY